MEQVISMSEFQAMVRQAATEEKKAKSDRQDRWVELALIAPTLFGDLCFNDGTKARETLRQSIRDAFPTPEAPARDDKSPQANEARAKRKDASTQTSVAMSRMKAYYEEAVGVKADQDKGTTEFSAWCATQIKALVGHGLKTKPRVHGKASDINALVEVLKGYAGEAYKPVKVTTGKKAKTQAKRASVPVVTQPASLSGLVNSIVNAPTITATPEPLKLAA